MPIVNLLSVSSYASEKQHDTTVRGQSSAFAARMSCVAFDSPIPEPVIDSVSVIFPRLTAPACLQALPGTTT